MKKALGFSYTLTSMMKHKLGTKPLYTYSFMLCAFFTDIGDVGRNQIDLKLKVKLRYIYRSTHRLLALIPIYILTAWSTQLCDMCYRAYSLTTFTVLGDIKTSNVPLGSTSSTIVSQTGGTRNERTVIVLTQVHTGEWSGTIGTCLAINSCN